MERIYVTVRSRPLSAEDSKNSPWRIAGNSIVLASQPPAKFDFDKIFGEDCKTAEIYRARTKDIVASAVRGFNGTVFAYGQTNSGKTHTMRGSAAEPGIIPLAVHDLFESIQEDVDREFLVRMSYMEIYNEEINDLLAPEHRKLQIHESLERGIYVGGLKEEIVTCPEQVLDFMEFGESHRHIGETNMNLRSSRSHTIFRMIVESRERSEDVDQVDTCDAVRVSVLNLVDLAGSERAAKTGAEGMRLKEGSHINRSLMTLGTVIKKLSEGAESQGGHVPYRDSKLTRILQPALGGNANTAMICNITLAQAHTDETKSSLQFASRALRVTNCACVNEILTDAALLRRQRKEIEELRAKLLSSHSDHWEEEILNLRNTLLQSELEKERIALELEEEKKAKAHHEKRLLEQIANLSSFVFCSERDEKSTYANKNKRRVTWCPVPSAKKCADEACTPDRATTMGNHFEHKLDKGMPVPFEVLMQENEPSIDACLPFETGDGYEPRDFSLPDAHMLQKVTNRRKKHVNTASLYVANNESVENHLAYEDEASENHSQKNVEVEKESSVDKLSRCNTNQSDSFSSATPGNISLSVREKEAILIIKQLQDQIKSLESEKASIQNNLDSVLQLATKQNLSFTKKYEEEATNAREEAMVAREQLMSAPSLETSKQEIMPDLSVMVSMEVKDLALQVNHSRNSVDDILSFSDDLLQSFAVFSDALEELRSFASQDMFQIKSIIHGHNDLQMCMKRRIDELEMEKNLLYKRSVDYEKQVQELISDAQNRENTVIENNLQHDLEKDELLSQVLNLQKEVSYLSSSSLVKEMEILRKELDKSKSKLKDTESKLKNAVQDKMKIEGEKAQAEREIRQLHSQKAVLERDMLKRDSVMDKRRESKSDFGRPKGYSNSAEQTLQENYQKLEVRVFEMEAEIASLKEALIIANESKEEACRMNEFLNSEVESISNKLNATESEIKSLKDENEVMVQRLIESEKCCKEMQDSIGVISREKEEMALQLTDALLEMEAEKSTWATKKKALVDANEKIKIQSDEIIKLTESLAEVKSKFDLLSAEHCHVCEEVLKLQEQLTTLIKERDESTHLDVNSDPGIDLPKDYENLKSDLLKVCKEKDELLSNNEKLNFTIIELETQKKQWEDTLLMVKTNSDELAKKLSDMEIKMHSDGLNHNKETTDLMMQIQSLQGKLDAIHGKYKEAVKEMAIMNRKYEEASTKLKKQLATYGVEILNLKKQLAAKE